MNDEPDCRRLSRGGVLTPTQGHHSVRPGDFYSETVRPLLFERLDQVFPEFGWRRDARGWVATNEQHTHARFGVRAERVVAHGPIPPTGFYIHGEGPVLWTEYVNGGVVPTGADFVRVVKEIAERAGLDTTPLERAQPHDRRADLLQSFFELCRRELTGDGPAAARAYLERRGFPGQAIPDSGLGLVPPAIQAGRQLERLGYPLKEIAAAGVLADSRWPGRLCGAWRDEHGRVGTLWARSVKDAEQADSRYLYLKGATRTNLPPYGLSDVLRLSPHAPRDLVMVEGVMDLHQLRARGIENVTALGGTSVNGSTFERLHRLGVESVTLCLDNDDAGRAATASAIDSAARAARSPHIYVLDSRQLGPAKDPDEFVQQHGIAAWRELLQTPECGIVWSARRLAGITPESPAAERRAALERAGHWLGSLPPRLALEQEDAVRAVADQSGYTPEAVERAFRARYWSHEGEHERLRQTQERTCSLAIGQER